MSKSKELCSICNTRYCQLGLILCKTCLVRKEIEDQGHKICSNFYKNSCKTPAITAFSI